MATQRVTQEVVEVLRQEDNENRVTQIVSEVLRQEDNENRVTQLVVEVLREAIIPVAAFEGWGSAI